ncbi:Xaa-Pro aminopeptidase [Thiofilum flexile]|uniref:Xaa-Pro aminopeptidase n=1 Tax=Thiofilum flexile TaxID=125627 RepID=UPI00037E65F4|nr:Xaa-Pro aminopeptidase [Thiofilum flexile]
MAAMPEISFTEYAERRQRVLKHIGADSVAIINASTLKTRNHDAEYIFRQDSDFYYLTGFNEPEAVAVLIPNRAEGEYVLFCRERDPAAEQWTGYRAGIEGAKAKYGANESYPISQLAEIMPKLLANKDCVYYRMGMDWIFDKQVFTWLNGVRAQVRAGIKAPTTFKMLDELVHEMRLIKSEAELAVMRHAAQIAAQAHTRAMQVCQTDMYEYEVEAVIAHEFRRHGMETAYTSIVGGGKNGCILHYIENRDPLNAGDLLLIDAGAEYQCYASDITRTFPVNGKFSPAQKALYQVVLDAQYAAINTVRPDALWDDVHQAAVSVLVDGLINLGLLTEAKDKILADSLYRKFYMHRTGHWLGLDVHDVGAYKVEGEWRRLQAGMVLTVEPGLYIPAEEGIDPKWWHIGIRIEDDVLVTESGCEVLTAGVVKEISAIESLMAQGKGI